MNGWKKGSLESLTKVFTDGNWIESKDQSDGGIRLIQTGNIGLGEFRDKEERSRYIDSSTFSRLRCTEIFSGDVLISRLPDPVGRACLMPDIQTRAITAVDCTICRFNDDRIIPKFFLFYSQSNEYLKDVDSQCTGATRRRISRKNLGQIQIPVPPLSEQKRIVEILDEAFDGIAKATTNAQRNLANARELFEIDLSKTFSGTHCGWIESTIGEICTLKSGQTLPPESEKKIGDIPYLKVADMTFDGNETEIFTSSRYVSQGDVKPSGIIPVGATIFPKRGGAILTNKKRITRVPTWLDLNIMAAIPLSDVCPEFIWMYFESVDMRRLGSGASIPQINNYDIAPLKIALPRKLSEQKLVADRLLFIKAQCVSLQRICQKRVSVLEGLKQSLLHKAFTGQLTGKEDIAA